MIHGDGTARRLGDLVELARDTVTPERIPQGVQYVGLEDIAGESGNVTARAVDAGELRSGKFSFTERHLLYGKLRPNLRKVARPDLTGICSTDILPLLPRDGVDRGFLFHWLRQPSVVAHVSAEATGVNLPRISPKRLLELQVPLPPLTEQRRIAALLDRADAVRRKRKESRRLVDKLLRSVFLEMFGDPVRNEKGWEVVTARQVILDTQYGTATRANSEGRGLPILRMNNITYSGQIDLSDLKSVELSERDLNKFTVRCGDLLFNRTNSPELVGKTAVWDRDGDYAFAGYLVRVRLNNRLALPEYVSAVLNSESGKSMLRSVAKPSINMSNISASDFGRLRIPLPPLALQERFQKAERQVRTRLAVSFQVAESSSERLTNVLQQGALTDLSKSSLGE